MGRYFVPSIAMCCRSLLVAWIGMSVCGAVVTAEDPWEYRPYNTQIWVSIDPAVRCTDANRAFLYRSVLEQIDVSFGAGVNAQIASVPAELTSKLRFELASLDPTELQEEDLVLAIAKGDEFQSVRNIPAALEKLESIPVSNGRLESIKANAALEKEPMWGNLVAKLAGSSSDLVAQLKDGSVKTALISRAEFDAVKSVVRQIPLRAPWQVEGVLRQFDKLMLVHIDQEDESLRIRVRELDCYLRYFGQVWTGVSSDWEMAPRNLSHLLVQAFTPMVRIEEANNKLANVRVRGSRLILGPTHPLLFDPGDVILPLVVRAERGGSDNSMQVIPWTYVAVIDGDQVRKRCAIYSGISGGLSGQQNSRIRRVGLKVRTQYPQTSIQFATTDESHAGVPGVSAFLRTPGEQNLDPIGRSDWRGILDLPKLDPPQVHVELPLIGIRSLDMVAPEERAAAQAQLAEEYAKAHPGEPVPEFPKPSADGEKIEPPKTTVQLNVPLYLFFVKNGDTVLARLPIVLGVSQVETAEIPDDSRRLEAEAHLRGLQSEILDLIAKREMYKIRIRKKLEKKDLEEAKKLLAGLMQLKNYDRMAESLANIQRKVLDSNRSAIPQSAQNKIDKMFKDTRDMMAKYLSGDFLIEVQALVRNAGGGSGEGADEAPDEAIDKSAAEQLEAQKAKEKKES